MFLGWFLNVANIESRKSQPILYKAFKTPAFGANIPNFHKGYNRGSSMSKKTIFPSMLRCSDELAIKVSTS